MTINYKRTGNASWWQHAELAAAFGESLSDKYRAMYAKVPVTVRKHRMPAGIIMAEQQKLRTAARAILHAEYIRDMIQY